MSNGQQLLPGNRPTSGSGTPPYDPLAASVISFLRFEDVNGTTVPVDEIAGVVWDNSKPARNTVSNLASRGGASGMRRDSSTDIAGGLRTTLAAWGAVWTLEGYVRIDALPFGYQSRYFLIENNTSSLQFFPDIYFGPTMRITTPYADYITTKTIVFGQWVHFALVADGTTIKFYADHVEYMSETRVANYITPVLYSAGCARGINGDYYTGFIDEFRVTLAARDPSNFLPVAGYAATPPLVAASISGLRVNSARGNLGGGLTANSPGLAGQRAALNFGVLGGAAIRLQGQRANLRSGSLVAYPFTELRYTKPPANYTVPYYGTPGSDGSIAEVWALLQVLPTGSVQVRFGNTQSEADSATPVVLNRWLTEVLPNSAEYTSAFVLSAEVYHIEGNPGTVGETFYPAGQYGISLQNPWSVYIKASGPRAIIHYARFLLNIQLRADFPGFGAVGTAVALPAVNNYEGYLWMNSLIGA